MVTMYIPDAREVTSASIVLPGDKTTGILFTTIPDRFVIDKDDFLLPICNPFMFICILFTAGFGNTFMLYVAGTDFASNSFFKTTAFSLFRALAVSSFATLATSLAIEVSLSDASLLLSFFTVMFTPADLVDTFLSSVASAVIV